MCVLGTFLVTVLACAVYVTFVDPDAGYKLRSKVGL